jgi:hypothetical protein
MKTTAPTDPPAIQKRNYRAFPVSERALAEQVLDLLVDVGPMTGAEACDKLGWPRGRFDRAVRFARERVCPELGMTIPAPTPTGGWLYQVTTEWQPVAEGAEYTLSHVDSRLEAIYRDVGVVLPHLERGSKDFNRANFLNKHLSHILRVLSEIEHGQG